MTAQKCELGGCKFPPLCEWCEQAEIIAATKHLRDPSVYSPLAARWGMAGQLPPPEIEAYIEQVLADVSGGSSSSLTPGAGDATQGAKDAEPGTASDSPPPPATTPEGDTIRTALQGAMVGEWGRDNALRALAELETEIDRLRREIDSLRPHVEGIGYAG